jgi:cyanophycin synthetase
MLDYAHNPAGLRALQKLVDRMDGHPKVGIIAGIGDRRREDNVEIARVAAEMFDEVIIRQDKNLRGKTEQELIDMLEEGIRSVDLKKPYRIIRSEKDAIEFAISNVKPGSLIVVCSDVVPDALEQVMSYKEKETENLYRFNTEDIPNLKQDSSS